MSSVELNVKLCTLHGQWIDYFCVSLCLFVIDVNCFRTIWSRDTCGILFCRCSESLRTEIYSHIVVRGFFFHHTFRFDLSVRRNFTLRYLLSD